MTPFCLGVHSPQKILKLAFSMSVSLLALTLELLRKGGWPHRLLSRLLKEGLFSAKKHSETTADWGVKDLQRSTAVSFSLQHLPAFSHKTHRKQVHHLKTAEWEGSISPGAGVFTKCTLSFHQSPTLEWISTLKSDPLPIAFGSWLTACYRKSFWHTQHF